MKYTELTKEQLADNFDRVAQDFYELIRDNGLEETEVDMDEGLDNREPELNLCDTPACHGGWAAIMYGDNDDNPLKEFYELGADLLAKKLGFSSAGELTWWADSYDAYWGNFWGVLMFSDKRAFGKGFEETLSLKDIPAWYIGVAERLRGGVVWDTQI